MYLVGFLCLQHHAESDWRDVSLPGHGLVVFGQRCGVRNYHRSGVKLVAELYVLPLRKMQSLPGVGRIWSHGCGVPWRQSQNDTRIS